MARFSMFQILVLAVLMTFAATYRRDPADKQLEKWRRAHRRKVRAIGGNYQPVPSLTATQSVGAKGPLVWQDFNYQSYIANTVNARIPERVVHAKAAGAKGYFVVTNEMSRFTRATLFSRVGKKTPVVVRLSTVAGSLGSADTAADQRGFGVKFKTEQGIYDLLMVNVPAFPIRDVMLFPEVSRSRTKNPSTYLSDSNMYFDYTSFRPESTFNVFLLHSNLSYFKNYRHMEGHAITAFKWTGGTETKEEPVFVRYQMLPDLKPVTCSVKMYNRRAGLDPDYMLRDLYNAIARKKYPKYTLFVQMFTMKDVKAAKFDMFDPTKMLFHADFPLIEVGKLILNENPTDYFNDVEQVAYNPGNLIPGIEISPDRLLQGRILAYIHTQTHRLGPNFFQLPINRPLGKVKGQSYFRDGAMNIDGNGDGGPAYYPNSFNGPYVDPSAGRSTTPVDAGEIDAYDNNNLPDADHFSQIDRYYREIMSPKQRTDTIVALAQHLVGVSKEIQERSLRVNWDPINDEIGKRLRQEIAKLEAKETSNVAGRRKNKFSGGVRMLRSGRFKNSKS